MNGFASLGGSNSGHSSATNITVNHHSKYGLLIQNEIVGMTFTGLMAYTDSIYISGSTNIKFIGCDFNAPTWRLTANTNIWLTNPYFHTAVPTPTIVSGEGLRTILPPSVKTLTDGATITWNVLSGKTASVTLGAAGRTLTITNAVSGDYYTIKVIQDGTGSRTITTWPTGTIWKGGAAPTLTTTAGAVDIISFMYDGTNFIGTYQLDNK